eukprot:5173456-Amphidinium_carterae.1
MKQGSLPSPNGVKIQSDLRLSLDAPFKGEFQLSCPVELGFEPRFSPWPSRSAQAWRLPSHR